MAESNQWRRNDVCNDGVINIELRRKREIWPMAKAYSIVILQWLISVSATMSIQPESEEEA